MADTTSIYKCVTCGVFAYFVHVEFDGHTIACPKCGTVYLTDVLKPWEGPTDAIVVHRRGD